MGTPYTIVPGLVSDAGIVLVCVDCLELKYVVVVTVELGAELVLFALAETTPLVELL